MSKLYTLAELFNAPGHTDSNFNFVYAEDGVTITVFGGATFVDYAKQKYYSRLYPSWSDAPLTVCYGDFVRDFTLWVARNGHNYARIINMIHSDYNPLENYDRLEEGSVEVTRVNGERRQSASTTITATTESNTYTYGDNSANPVPESKTENSITYPEGVEGDTSSTMAESYTDTDTTTYNNHRIHGNVGVTTGAQLFEGEYNIRIRDYVARIMDEFIDQYTLYV